MPRVGAIRCVVRECTKEWWRQRIHVDLGFAHDISRDELRRVFIHVNEAVKFAQDVIGNVA